MILGEYEEKFIKKKSLTLHLSPQQIKYSMFSEVVICFFKGEEHNYFPSKYLTSMIGQ